MKQERLGGIFMIRINHGKDEVYVFKNFLSDKECDKYFKKIRDIGHLPYSLPWPERVIDITKDRIVKKVTKFINKNFNLKLTAEQAEIQNHHVNSSADLHIHNDLGREHIIYNSLIYLNDNFDGGHFITKNGISIKPEKGMLTFFNGQKVYHGVKRVLKNDRKTIIFWWRK
jgi:spore maturation protein CgeB